MKLLAFSVYDEKSQAFAHPFFTSAIGIASRMMSDWANNKDTLVGAHPEDFVLYHVGYWLDDQAKFDNNQTPVRIGAANDYIEPKQMLQGAETIKQFKERQIS